MLTIARLRVKEGLVRGVSRRHPSFSVQPYDPTDISGAACTHLLDNAACDQVAFANS